MPPTMFETDCVAALKTGVQAQLTADGLTTVVFRAFCTDDDSGETDEDRVYPAVEVYWMPYVPIGYRTSNDHAIPMVLRVVTHHGDDQKGVNCATIYESVREAIDGYDFGAALVFASSGQVLVTGSDSGIEGMVRFLELQLEWKVCG